ncbi:hypothetical protein VaNZ11_013789, partial [Volvox africanus]
ALSKEVNELPAQLVEVKADGRGAARRLWAVEGLWLVRQCSAVLGGLKAFKSARSTPAGRCERHAPAAPITPSMCPCLPATVGVIMTRSPTTAREGLFPPPPASASRKRTQRDDGSHGSYAYVAVKRTRRN